MCCSKSVMLDDDIDAVAWNLPYDDPKFANYLFNHKICKRTGHRIPENIGINPTDISTLMYCHYCNHIYPRFLTPEELEAKILEDEFREDDSFCE